MKSFTALTLLGACAVAQAVTYVGCSSSAPSLRNSTGIFMSVGQCEYNCDGEAGFAISGEVCQCGELPAQDDLVEDALCNTPCPGFASQMCGGDGLFSLYSLN